MRGGVIRRIAQLVAALRITAVLALALPLIVAGSATAQAAQCRRLDGSALSDELWRRGGQRHRLIGQVLKAGEPIALAAAQCASTPLQQLIIEVWQAIRAGGLVLIGEVHDNPEHHRVRGDILWPRLEPLLNTRDLAPAAVFEHIRVDQQDRLDGFYAKAARSRRLWRASDLLRELAWESSGWPPGKSFEPLFDAALRARLPILPGNAPRARIRALARGEPGDVTPAEAARLALARSMPGPLEKALTRELEASHCGALPAPAFAAMSLAQRYTDAHLAGTLVEAADRRGAAFLLAGNGHVRSDRGVPWYTRRLAPGRKTVAVLLLEVEEGDPDGARSLPRGPDGTAADYILFTPRHDRPDPCANMRQGRP
jgi:uncharacterized iron-regulated protein